MYGPDGRPIDDIARERDRERHERRVEVVVTRIDLGFGNIVVLAIKIGIVWAVMGLVAAVIFRALS